MSSRARHPARPRSPSGPRRRAPQPRCRRPRSPRDWSPSRSDASVTNSASRVRSARSSTWRPSAAVFSADSLPTARSWSESNRVPLPRGAGRRAGRRCRSCRFGSPVELVAVAPQLFAAAVQFLSDPAELARGFVPELHEVLSHHCQLARLSLIRCERTSSSASSDWASLLIAMTERVKGSASLRRVRPKISQTSPSSAKGPAAMASHWASSGDESDCPASVRPADHAE